MCEFTTCRWWWNVQSKLMMENNPIPTGWDDLKNGLRHVILDVNLYNYTTSLLIKTFWDVGNYCFH